MKSSDTDAVEAAQHIRDRNERMIETSVRAGFSSLELCRKALKSIADLQEAVGDGSQLKLRHCRGPGQVHARYDRRLHVTGARLPHVSDEVTQLACQNQEARHARGVESSLRS